jgi:hypothetical protein
VCDPKNHDALVRQFLDEYPTSTGGDDRAMVSSVLPVLKGGAAAQEIRPGTDVTRTFNRVARDPNLSTRSVADVSREISLPSNRTSNQASVAQTSRPATTSGPSASSDIQPGPMAGPVPNSFVPVDPTVAPQATQRPETIRQNLARNAEEDQEARAELASLRELLEKRNANGQRNPQENADILARLDQLKDRIAGLESDKTRLERQLAEAENSRDERRAPASESDGPVSNRNRNRSQAAAVSAPSVVPQVQGGATSGALSAPVSSGSVASLNSPSLGGSTARGGSSARNAALLSINEAKSAPGSQGGITVDNSAAANVARLEVSPEQFASFSIQDQASLDPIFEKAGTIPGDVVQVQVVAGGETSIYIVDKVNRRVILDNGNPSRAIASETAPAVEPVRNIKLEDLTREFAPR